ncbi:uncharacterized protein BROUX77_005142 [Berkeleyomyces rouxiae]|uniref:uncharacterized protein n=1 Tax=Berkeleyomyces rouxiae TaxID=2035830 RepID=UPI003B807244
MEVGHDPKTGTVTMRQQVYIERLLVRFGVDKCTPRKTPMVKKTFALLFPKSNEAHHGTHHLCEEDKAQYQKLVGSFQWLSTMTRPDITFATSLLARFVNSPTESHLQAAKYLLRYLRGTITRGLYYSAQGDQGLQAFTDAAYADDLIDRKSTSAYLFKLAGAPIAWKSQKQIILSGSTADA